MPQDGRKLAKYSPFVTCNDPKGVVECGTIRKSKLSSYQTMEPRTDNQTKFKNPNRAVASITNEKDRGDDLRGRVSLQLSEVSKGAEKLNHMIDSWSMNLAVEGQPKDLAKDLLKGAIDLQESLMMLGKLQAASKYVSKLKKKQEKSNNNGGQEGRGFRKQEELSKEKIEELKEIIRSSFERQNLLRGGNGGKGHFDQFDQEPDVPSTSSRHSSSSYNEKIDGKLEKSIAKGPGIIAKLMGLEEISSKPMQKKPLFNTEMQMTKLKDRICEVSNGEKKKKKKTLKEVLDTMHLKGILKGNSVNSHRVSRNTDMMRPIVLIKPLQIPPPENDEVKTVEFCKEKEEKVKPSTPSNPKQLRREVSNKKPSENEKKKMSDRRSLEKGMAQNHVNKTVKFESKPKVVVAKKGNDSSKERKENGQKQRKQLRMHQSDQKKIRKIDQQTVNEPKEAKLAKEDAIKINSSSEIDIGVDMNSIHTNQQSIEVIQDASGSRICGGIDVDDAEEITSVKGYDYGNRRSLLLSSQSFVTRAEDLFSFTSSCSPTNSEKPDSQSPNTRLYIDCATELIERKSLHASETHCLILPWYLRSSTTICISMEKLVEEVCDGVEILSSYWSLQSHSSPVDGLYAVLKRDLNQNRRMVGSKLWDMGWNKVFSSDDFDKVVIELEEIIFSCLIEELFRGQI